MLPVLLAFLLVGCAAGEKKPTAAQAPEAEIVMIVAETPVQTNTPIPTPLPAAGASPRPTDPLPNDLPLTGIVIGIDPGHQKKSDATTEPNAPWDDTGKARVAGGCRGVDSRIYEYELVLQIGLRLRDLLAAQGAAVILTRDTNEGNISNKERAELFNEYQVDLGIRLHLNNGKERGAFMLVPKKNCTDWYEQNVAAAKAIIARYCRDTDLPMVRAQDDGITYRGDQTGFNWCTRPIVGIEMGHLSDKEDDALFSDPAFWDVAAAALCRGITEYFEKQV